MAARGGIDGARFQSTPSVWRATCCRFRARRHSHFNPRPPCGGRRKLGLYAEDPDEFQSTPSVWRATAHQPSRSSSEAISIHALRVEGDLRLGAPRVSHEISIHALRVEGDQEIVAQWHTLLEFQSTPSVWRATTSVLNPWWSLRFQSTPSVWRATSASTSTRRAAEFQSTPSVWRATPDLNPQRGAHLISIHALRVEGDPPRAPPPSAAPYFNPRPPCGGRRSP